MNKTQQGYFFKPQQSTGYIFYLIFVHLFTFICFCMIAPLFLDGVFLLLIAISFFYYFFRSETIISLHFIQKTEWILKLNSGELMRAELLQSSVMMRYFVVLHFKLVDVKQKKRMVLFSDHFLKEEYRALRRCMKIGYL